MVLPPNEGREGSFKSLRESRAAGSGLGGRSSVGPSDENRILRSALLSRTFESQILFGSGGGEDEALERFGRPGARTTHNERPPPAAGGGRMGRVAEGAAWTPGGRRLIPGSKAFVSHLRSGMMARKDASAENDEEASSTSSGSFVLLSAKKSRELAAARAPPVWIPKPDPRSSTPIAVATDTSGKVAASDRRVSGSISLAQLMDSGGDSSSGHGHVRHTKGGEISSNGHRTAPSPSTPDRNHNTETSEKNGQGRCMDQPSVYAAAEKEPAFDWWGGAGVSDTDTGRERAVGRPIFRPRPKSVSDTYKSSLVFG